MDIQDAVPRWTVEAVDRLRQLADARVPAEVISQAMHRPLAEILAKAAELDLSLEPVIRAN